MVKQLSPTQRWDRAVLKVRAATATYSEATLELEQARAALLKELTGCSTAVTHREKEVLKLVKDGKSNKEIANLLHIEERTVKFHVANLLKKFNASRRHQL